jgi:putative spermidine/putrescine transport system permease protein
MKQPPWGILAFVLLAVWPVSMAFGYALLYSLELVGLLSSGFTLDHWSRALRSRDTWASLGLSVAVAAAVTGLSAVVAFGWVRGLGTRLDGGWMARGALIPIATPAVVAALVVLQWFSASGWLNRALTALGWLSAPTDGWSWVQDPASVGIVLAHAYGASAFLALAFRGIVRTERIDELETLAASLGASVTRRVTGVVIPVLLRRAVGPLSLVFVVTLGSYEIPLLLGRQSPQMLSILVQRKFGRYDLSQKPEAMVIAVLYAVLLTAAVWILIRSSRREETHRA